MSVIVDSPLSEKCQSLRNVASNLLRMCQIISTRSQGWLDANAVIQFYKQVGEARSKLAAHIAIPGLGAYADGRVGGDYDSVISWIEGAFPANGGYILAATIADGNLQWRSFSAAGLSGFRSAITAITDAISIQG